MQESEIDPAYAFLDAGGRSLCIDRDPLRTADEIRRFTPPDARAYLALAEQLDTTMDLVDPVHDGAPERPPLGGNVEDR